MSREMREMLGDNEEALALYTREYGKANQKELWTPADFAKERVFEAVSTGKFYILVRLYVSLHPACLLSLADTRL